MAQLREMSRPLGIEMSLPAARVPRVDADTRVELSSPGEVPTSSTDENGPTTEEAPSYRQTWDDDTIHKSLLAGLLSQIGMQDTGEVKASAVAHLRGEARERALKRAKKQARNEYVGARGARFAIFPGSPLSKKPPVWIMAGELVETSRLWARDVARIQPEWAEDLAGPLAKRTYSEPHWSTKQGAAMCTEKVLLYGVPIVSDRRVLYAKVDPEAAREMFVRHALVQGEWTTHHRFFHDNRALLEEAGELEARSRQRGLVADEDDLFAFYDERVPDSVVSAAHFDKWWSRARKETPDLLTFTMEQLVGDASVDTAQFPGDLAPGRALPAAHLPVPARFRRRRRHRAHPRRRARPRGARRVRLDGARAPRRPDRRDHQVAAQDGTARARARHPTSRATSSPGCAPSARPGRTSSAPATWRSRSSPRSRGPSVRCATWWCRPRSGTTSGSRGSRRTCGSRSA